ncbi:MAG: general secretion pathway protein GspK [Planctomycetaceae bacterium]
MTPFPSSSITKRLNADSRGIALVMVLWVVTILSVVVLEFCYAMRTEVNITRNYQEELRLYAAAEGSAQRAIAELILKHDPRMQNLRKSAKEGELPPENREWATDGREYRFSFEAAEGVVRVLGEAGKVNINRVSDAALRKIMGTMGLEGEDRDIAVDSILDWRDPDDFVRVNGAENDYYQSLKEPYDCKNGNLDSVEELLLVRGITPELFYGKKVKEKEGGESQGGPVGLKDIFSIYAAGEQIDINSATLPALRVVLGLPLEVCRLIIKAREDRVFDNLQDLSQRVPEIRPFLPQVQNLMLFRVMNPYYTVESRGKSKEGSSVRGIRMVVKVDPREKDGFKIVRWLDSSL